MSAAGERCGLRPTRAPAEMVANSRRRLDQAPEACGRIGLRDRSGHRGAAHPRRPGLIRSPVTEVARDGREDRAGDQERVATKAPSAGLTPTSRRSNGSAGSTTDWRVPRASASMPSTPIDNRLTRSGETTAWYGDVLVITCSLGLVRRDGSPSPPGASALQADRADGGVVFPTSGTADHASSSGDISGRPRGADHSAR
jgi:hypothetical protein